MTGREKRRVLSLTLSLVLLLGLLPTSALAYGLRVDPSWYSTSSSNASLDYIEIYGGDAGGPYGVLEQAGPCVVSSHVRIVGGSAGTSFDGKRQPGNAARLSANDDGVLLTVKGPFSMASGMTDGITEGGDAVYYGYALSAPEIELVRNSGAINFSLPTLHVGDGDTALRLSDTPANRDSDRGDGVYIGEARLGGGSLTVTGVAGKTGDAWINTLLLTGGGTFDDTANPIGLGTLALDGGELNGRNWSGIIDHAYEDPSIVLADGGGTFRLDRDAALSHTLTGAGALTKAGTGLLRLTGTNTHSGGTAVEGGALVLDSAAAAGTGAVTVAGGAGLELAFAGAFPNDIAGAGTLTKTGAGPLRLTGTVTYSGGTAVEDGTLVLDSAAAAGTGAVTVAEGAGLELAFAGEFPNDIAGAGSLVIDPGAGGETVLGGDIACKTLTVRSGGVKLTGTLACERIETWDDSTFTLKDGSTPIVIEPKSHTVTAGEAPQTPAAGVHYTVENLGGRTLTGSMAMRYVSGGFASPSPIDIRTYAPGVYGADAIRAEFSGVTAADGTPVVFHISQKPTVTVAAPSGSSGGSGNSGGSGDSDDGPSFTDEALRTIRNAEDGGTVKLNLPYDGKLPGKVLEEAAGRDITLELRAGTGAAWILQGTDIPQGKLSDLNLKVDTAADTIPVTVLNALTGEKTAMQLELRHDGPFGFPLTLRLEVGTESAGLFANLYYYDETARALEYQSTAKIGADGKADIPFSHASSYAVVIDQTSHAPAALPFTDVTKGDWCYDAVAYVYGAGLMMGTTETAFGPAGAVTRAQVWTVLARLDGADTSGGAPWYAPAQAWAVEKGVSDGTNPDGPVTREQLVTMLYRYAQSAGRDVSVGGDTNILSYTDAFDVAEWAIPAFQWACGSGIVSGTSGATLSPRAGATRAQLAAILQRFSIGMV
ncbi:S-layer homology domain-containing protein [uncultured Oscillibacter sp.]|uniref:S-layer homology domain-containing protein n=1 Tax=uncultured Oscillibacter sp. TaxID=876091 RepID=UPI00280625A8|nr:S-layer homology domain-containing protein [uncultured Oscillibacter sp.]